MPLIDVFASRLSGPAGRVLDAPIRALVHEILREQGYASPAEIQALRDDAKDLSARLTRVETRLGELTAGQAATLHELKAAQEALLASRAELSDAHRSGSTHHAALAEPAPLTAALRGPCVVPECGGAVRSKGFCSAHYQQWRRGTLDGFVGQDGHIRVGKRELRVSDQHAGRHGVLDGDTLSIDGKVVATR